MTTVELKKSNFVAKLSILFSTFGLYDVETMVYLTDSLTFETVMITFTDGSNKSVNVRMDGFEAILNDILKALKEDY